MRSLIAAIAIVASNSNIETNQKIYIVNMRDFNLCIENNLSILFILDTQNNSVAIISVLS